MVSKKAKRATRTAPPRAKPAPKRNKKALPKVERFTAQTAATVTYEMREVSLQEAQEGGFFSGWYDLARYQWLSGDCHVLAQIQEHHLQHHPERARLALLAASAKIDCGRPEEARALGRKAMDWGCPRAFATQVLAIAAHRRIEAAAREALRPSLADRHREAVALLLDPASKHARLAGADYLPAKNQPALASSRSLPRLDAPALHRPSPGALPVKQHAPLQIVVLGMHRSGTSCLTGVLKLMGAHIGLNEELTGSNWENPKGFWERRDMRNLCDTLLHAAGCDWDKVDDFNAESVPVTVLEDQKRTFADIVARLDTNNAWAAKEPRLSLLLPLLLPMLSNPVALHIYRHPIETAMSLAKRNKVPIDRGLRLWETYNRAILQTAAQIPCFRVSYADLVRDPLAFCRRFMAALPSGVSHYLRIPPREEIYHFVEGGLYRHRAPHDPSDGRLSETQRQLVRLLEDKEV